MPQIILTIAIVSFVALECSHVWFGVPKQSVVGTMYCAVADCDGKYSK